MPIYEYRALTEKGLPTTGVIDADTPKEAREKLRARKVHVTEMVKLERAKTTDAAAASPLPLRIPGRGRSRGGAGDVPMVTRQLSTLLKAGIPLNDSLGALIQQIEHRSLERAFRQIKEDISSGSPTGEAFARHPQYFNSLYVNMIKAGEASGNMDVVLKRLADFLQKQSKMRGKVTAALVYPIAMMVLGAVVVAFLMTFVVPKIVASIKERGMPLPAPTEILMAISGFIASWWWACLIAIFLGLTLYGMWVRTPEGRLKRDTWLLKMPVFGQLFKKQSVARFAITFSTLLKSGIPALECLKILRDIVDNALLSKTLDEVHDRIIEGADIATPLKDSGVFPPVVGYMISIGEQTGQLEDILDKVAEAYDEEIDVTTQKVTALIEPVIIVFMALVVGFIVLSVVLPLVQGFNV